MTFLEAAESVLREADETLRPEQITERALADGRLQTEGATPDATMAAQLSMSIKQRGKASPFARKAPNIFGLRIWVEEGRFADYADATDERRVRLSHYPIQSWVQAALPLFDGVPAAVVTGMQSSIARQRGNPQATKDWSDPDVWIGETLDREEAAFARRLWSETSQLVNPRYLRETWRLTRLYDLVEETTSGVVAVTDRGREFVASPEGATVREIDDREGLLELLSFVSELGQARRGDLLEPWRDYLADVSNFRADSSTSAALSDRMRNLSARGYLDRSGHAYSLTPEGLAWLGGDPAAEPGPDTHHEIVTLARHQRRQTQETLLELLREMDPYAFEGVVARLLDAMGYDSPEVTPRGGDGGVDVVATIEMGITTVTEVVQAKRTAGNVSRPVLDALRGSLHRFRADRGTIITTGGFSPGTVKAAVEFGAPPITLIDGKKLVELMIQHGIGVRKKAVELWDLDEGAFEIATNDEQDD